MNTRLQVEHPVTEAGHRRRSGARAAARRRPASRCRGRRRSLDPARPRDRGRVYAEDPAQRIPAAGRPLLLYREPRLPGIRVDSGVVEGGEVSVHYDPLLAKVIAIGRDARRWRSRG